NLLANFYQTSFNKFDEKAIKRLLTLKNPIQKYLQNYVDSNAHIEQLEKDEKIAQEDRENHSIKDYSKYLYYLFESIENINLTEYRKLNAKALIFHLRKFDSSKFVITIDPKLLKECIIDFLNVLWINNVFRYNLVDYSCENTI